ncbi:MAG: hypothetical protein QXK37_01985 [Candidatus Woesearchaeota archaeon]
MINKNRPFIDINKVKLPSYDLIDMNRYRSQTGRKWAVVMFSRGCPYSCKFCLNPKYSKRQYRLMSPKTAVAHLDLLEKLGVEKLIAGDSVFFHDIKKNREHTKSNRKEKIQFQMAEDRYNNKRCLQA